MSMVPYRGENNPACPKPHKGKVAEAEHIGETGLGRDSGVALPSVTQPRPSGCILSCPGCLCGSPGFRDGRVSLAPIFPRWLCFWQGLAAVGQLAVISAPHRLLPE